MTEGVTIPEAAVKLGVSEGAIRKRIKSGGLGASKGADGRWYVVLSTDRQPDEDGVPVSTTAQDSLVAELREQVDYLRRENERKDSIIMTLAQRLPELPAHTPRRPCWAFWSQR
jgi:hypothetical protein